MAKKNLFKEYQGQQIQPLAPGYLETITAGYNAIGQGIANLGKGIASGIEGAAKVKAEKVEAAGVVDQTNTQVNQFLKSGDLIKDDDGVIKPAPGKEGMFNNDKLRRTLDLYNTTQGRGIDDLSATEAKSVLGRYNAGVEQDKAAREDRALQLKEAAAEDERSTSKAKLGLELYKAANDAYSGILTSNQQARGFESDSGGINPENEADRKRKEEAAAKEVDGWRNYLRGVVSPAGPSAAKPQGGEQSAAPAANGETAVAGTPGSEFDLSVYGRDLANPRGLVASTTGMSPTGGPVPVAGSFKTVRGARLSYDAENPNGFSTLKSEDGSVYANGAVVALTGKGVENRKTTSVFGETIVNADTPSIFTDVDSGKVVLGIPSNTTANYEGVSKDLLIATRFANSGKVANLSISARQESELAKLNYPNYGAVDSTTWKRSLVGSLIAQGKMTPEPGQDITSLGRGPELHVNYEQPVAASTGVVNPGEPTFKAPSPSNINGIGLNTTLPSQELMRRRMLAGIPIDAPTIARYKMLDDQAEFQNRVLVQKANLDADIAAARASESASGKDVAETTSVYATLGTKLGEKLQGYPGVFEASGPQYGFFARRLPNRSSGPKAGTPWNTGDIAYIQSTSLNPKANPAERDAANASYTTLVADLARGQMSTKQMENAAKASADFQLTAGALTTIRSELDRQIDDGTARAFVMTTMENLGIGRGSENMRSEKLHQLFLMGTLREPTVGPGNPAIYEQMLLLSGIPSVDGIFRIPKWEKSKLQTLALVSASSYISTMQQNGMQVTQEAVDDINTKLRSAYGDNFQDFTYDELAGVNGWVNVRNDKAKAEAWIRSRGGRYMTADQLREAHNRGR